MKPKLRTSRQGYPVPRWPLEHLAVIWWASITFGPAETLKKLPQNRPDIGRQYFARTGRKLTDNIIRNRIDKATRQAELDNYKRLLPMAKAEIDTWRKGSK